MSKLDGDEWARFDAIGEDQVRLNLASRIYGTDKALIAKAWLERNAQRRAEESGRRISASVSEQIEVARKANRIAMIAAVAATIAAIAAIAGATISILDYLRP